MTNYLLFVATSGGLYALLALSLTLLWGLTGMVNLGLAGFFAVGAYASALLALKAGTPFVFALLGAAFVSAIAGAVLTFATRRLEGDYLAIVTLGFAEVVRLVALNETWLTRGSDGLSAIPMPLKSTLGDGFNVFYFGVVAAAVALLWFAIRRLARSPYGRVLRAIRDDAQVAAVAGKPVARFKLQVFAVSAAIAGLAGGMYGHFTSYIAPDIFTPLITIYIFLAVTLGGTANPTGAVVGALAIMFLLEGSRFVVALIPGLSALQLAAVREFLIGALLIVIVHLRPQGLFPEARYRAPPPPPEKAAWTSNP